VWSSIKKINHRLSLKEEVFAGPYTSEWITIKGAGLLFILIWNGTRWFLANSHTSHLKSEADSWVKSFGNNFFKYLKDEWPKHWCHNQISKSVDLFMERTWANWWGSADLFMENAWANWWELAGIQIIELPPSSTITNCVPSSNILKNTKVRPKNQNTLRSELFEPLTVNYDWELEQLIRNQDLCFEWGWQSLPQ